MRNSTDVIAQVVNGKGPQLAEVLEVSPSRCYEILSTDNPYPKAKRLIRAIAQVNPRGIRLIRADMAAMFSDLLQESSEQSTEIELHKEAFEAVQACLEGKPTSDRARELRELIAVAQGMLESIDKGGRRERAKVATHARFNGK